MARKKSLNPILVSVAGWLIASYIRLVKRTTRWTVIGAEHQDALIDRGQNYICAAWHSRLMMMPTMRLREERPVAVLISENRDGELLANTVTRFGYICRRGSSRNPRKPEKGKGGASALKAMVADAKAGIVTALTPDGPRGPMQHAHLGVAQLARLTHQPIIPMAYSTRFSARINSWDRFLVPFPVPFGRGVIVIGEPVAPPDRSAEALDKCRRDLEERLNALTADADRRCGKSPLFPEAAPLTTSSEVPAE